MEPMFRSIIAVALFILLLRWEKAKSSEPPDVFRDR